MTIGNFLHTQIKTLSVAGSTTARLDVLVLLSDELKKDKSWILANLDNSLAPTQLRTLHTQCAERSKLVPLAYIRKKQQFYGRDFAVTPDVLIPRPESETIIDVVKQYSPASLLDVGTGSGCLAITAALELPDCKVSACDISQKALIVAENNSRLFDSHVMFFESDLLNEAVDRFAMIVANLPYVDASWSRSAETNAEPALALFADNNGLALIYKLLLQAPNHLKPHGLLVLEADPRQHTAIIMAAKPHFNHVATNGFIITLCVL